MDNETKYTIETYDKSEANLMLNATRMASVLFELLEWHRAIYNGRDGDYKVLYNNKLYDFNEWIRDDALNTIVREEDKNEYGFIKDGLSSHVYTDDFIDHKLEDLLGEVRDLICNYYE